MISRRSLLRAAPALILAPAIVRVTSIMPVNIERWDINRGFRWGPVWVRTRRDHRGNIEWHPDDSRLVREATEYAISARKSGLT